MLLLTARSAYKLKDAHLSSIQKKVEQILSDEQYALKGRTATHIDELIQVARFIGYKPDLNGKHENDIGEDGFNYFEAFFRDLDGKYYRVTLSAGINANEETVYSIGEIRLRSFPADRGSSSQKEALKNGRKASVDIIYTSAAKSQEIKTAVQIAYEKALGKKDSSSEKMRDYLSVKTKATSLGIITEQSLTDNLSRFRKEIKAFREENNISYSARNQDGISPRELLLNTLEGVVVNSEEWLHPQKYRGMIKRLNEAEKQLERLASLLLRSPPNPPAATAG